MPPNNPLSYENLQALDLSKHRHVSGFLPLTHPDEERLHQESLALESSKNAANVGTSSMKGFNAMLDQDNQEESLGLVVEEELITPKVVEPAVQTVHKYNEQYSEQVQGILAQEKAFHLLSCDCMVQNLVKDSVSRRQALEEEEQQEEAAIVESKEECYWDMPSSSSSYITTDVTSATTDVVTTCQECPVQAALESVVTSSSSNTCSDQVMTAAHVDDATHPNHAYWDHPSDSHMTPKDHQAQLLQSIMESEAIRNLLSAEHISQVEQLNSNTKVVQSVHVVGSSKQIQHEFYSNQVSDEYWNTSPTQVVEACHVQDGTHPHHSYWDESTTCTTIATTSDGTSTCTSADKKQALIDMIMEQERLRNLVSTDFIVQTELQSSTSTTSTTSPSSSPISSSTSSSTESNDYWTHPNQISSETMAELSRQDLIQQIVQEEKERQLVSTHAIVRQLIQDSQQQQQECTASCATSAAIVSSPCVVNTDSSSYWDW